MKAKKRFGQHFLRDIEVLEEIASLADVRHASGVLEIGPGEGALTAFLLRAGKPVVALEKDRDAVVELQHRFGDALNVVEGDALSAPLSELLPTDTSGKRPVVAGNLPYNVASPIFRRLLGLGDQVSRMVLMFQREVAARIVADPGTKAYGVPSVMRALTATATLVRVIPPEAFRPRPKVHSATIYVEPLAQPRADASELAGLDRFIGKLFQARRKTLANAAGDWADVFTDHGISLDRRSETLSPDEFLALFRALRDAGQLEPSA